MWLILMKNISKDLKYTMTANSTKNIIIVISNTHWDREFRKSFEKTRKGLLEMMDVLLEILENDPDYHSFTLDGHAILLEDYLEMRPEMRSRIEKQIRCGRLIAGPWYTLAEQFSITHEAILRNLLKGRKTVEKFGGKPGTVAYTPASWGQTGQLPQILFDFGLDKVMFYRGISHHESDAEFIWEAPDGTQILGSRFGLYARYNWYYQVHRPATRKGRVFEKEYNWNELNEIPVRPADSLSGKDPSFTLAAPSTTFESEYIADAVQNMIERESSHFTTPVFPAMNGHDISVAHPMETKIVKIAAQKLSHKYRIEQGSLEDYWREVKRYLKTESLSVLTGERRSYLKTGMWTYLFPGTISARTYLKQADFHASTQLVYSAEPLAALAYSLGNRYPAEYVERGWEYLLSNHTHDANGGCAPDAVCRDMEYRYAKTADISDIVIDDALSFVAKNISPDSSDTGVQLIVFNPLTFSRDAIIETDLELPAEMNAKSVILQYSKTSDIEKQEIYSEKSSVFVDNIWDVPTILVSNRIKFYALLKKLPPLGYRVYNVVPDDKPFRNNSSLLTGANSMENCHLSVKVNPNGTIDIRHKQTGKTFRELNYITDQGEAGNAWQHKPLRFDRKINSLGLNSKISIKESGPLRCTITADFVMNIPSDYADGHRRSDVNVDIPVTIYYTVEKDLPYVKIAVSLDNRAKDHWFRVNFPTEIKTDHSVADSHFDIIERKIKIPDSSDWVEEAGGTHPLRTFVDLCDGKTGLACFTKGLFEYEAFDDPSGTLAITLFRACRIKLKVSEEKIAELPDQGIQCLGTQYFEYALCPHSGDHTSAGLINLAADYYSPVRAIMSGSGKGTLPTETWLISMNNPAIHVSAVKMAEDNQGLIIRMFNTTSEEQEALLRFGQPVTVSLAGLDEKVKSKLTAHESTVNIKLGKKKIITLKVMVTPNSEYGVASAKFGK